MATLGSLIVKIGADLDPLKKGLSQTSKMTGDAVSKIGKAFAVGAVGGVAALGAGFVKVGVEAFSAASEIDKANKKMQSSLGVTAEEAEKFGAIGVEVYKNNFAGSIAEAADAVAMTAQQIKGIEFDQIQAATESALSLSDAFGADMEKSLNAVNSLMTDFGLTQQESFDFLTSGFQNGLDSSGDFLDSITEYSNLFGQAGADAGQFFSLLETGLSGGVLGTDKAADAFKEFQIRFIEGHKDYSSAFETLGLDYDNLREQVDSGAITMADAFGLVTEAISKATPGLETQEAVAKLGTQFEDMGLTAVAGIDLAKTSMGDLQGATETLGEQYNTIGSRWESVTRRMGVALAPLGEKMIAGIEAVLPSIEAMAEGMGPAIESGIATAESLWTAFSEKMISVWAEIGPSATQVFNDAVSIISGVWATLSPTITSALGTIEQLALSAFSNIALGMSTLLQIAQPIWLSMAGMVATFAENIGPIWSNVSETLAGVWETVVTKAKEGLATAVLMVSAFGETIGPIWSNVSTQILGVWDQLGPKVKESLSNAALLFTEFGTVTAPITDKISGIFTTEGEGGLGDELASFRQTWDNEMAELADSDALQRITESFSRVGDAFARIGLVLGIGPAGEGGGTSFIDVLGKGLSGLEAAVGTGVEVLEFIATWLETGATNAEKLADAFEGIQNGINSLSVGDKLSGIVQQLKDGASWIPSWVPLIGQSPSPLAVGIKTAADAARNFPDLDKNLSAAALGNISGVAEGDTDSTAGGSGKETIINVILDGKIIETIVSGRQGVRRQQRAALGGATAL